MKVTKVTPYGKPCIIDGKLIQEYSVVFVVGGKEFEVSADTTDGKEFEIHKGRIRDDVKDLYLAEHPGLGKKWRQTLAGEINHSAKKSMRR